MSEKLCLITEKPCSREQCLTGGGCLGNDVAEAIKIEFLHTALDLQLETVTGHAPIIDNWPKLLVENFTVEEQDLIRERAEQDTMAWIMKQLPDSDPPSNLSGLTDLE